VIRPTQGATHRATRTAEREFRAETIHGIVFETADLYPDRPALIERAAGGSRRTLTYRELRAAVDVVAESLRKLGIAKGDRVAICAYHGAAWVMADIASLKLGAIVVPVYHTLSPRATAHVLRDSGAKMVFVEDAGIFVKIESLRGDVPSVRTVVVFDPRGLDTRKDVLTLDDLRAGRGPLLESAGSDDIVPELPVVSPEDVATIVYTSGTTGDPKGVVLTHAGMVTNTLAGVRRFRVAPEDVYLSVLPMCHMLERVGGCYCHLFAGSAIAYGGRVATIVEDARSIRPTHLIVVPRIVEKVCEAVAQKVAERSPLRRKIVSSAVANLNRRTDLEYACHRVPPLLKLKCWFYDRAVAAKFRRLVGGRVKLLMCGGAPLDRKLAKLLWIMGFRIYDGYGLTEATLVVSTGTPGDNRLGTVGKPFPGVEVRIGDNEEVLVKGPSVMRGYYNRPEETAAAIDREGWLHTGDQGRFDERGNLVITGRIKELIVTSYGKNIGPALIEGEIARSPYIDQVILCGDNRKYLTALVVPNRQALERYAGQCGIGTADYLGLLSHARVRTMIGEEIKKATASCSPHEKVAAFVLVPEGFTVENDLLTPTLKLRRARIETKYAADIAAMYGASPGQR
jgi:long-chain acyl-CoA synthetase